MAAEVRAAGGVVVREGVDGFEVLLVHRPRYDDWTLPKGKGEPGEPDAHTALREVEEETGYRCALGKEVGETRYVDQRGRPKVVRYWRMTVEGGQFVANHEVDAIAWLSPDAARAKVSYPHDREIIDAGVREY